MPPHGSVWGLRRPTSGRVVATRQAHGSASSRCWGGRAGVHALRPGWATDPWPGRRVPPGQCICRALPPRAIGKATAWGCRHGSVGQAVGQSPRQAVGQAVGQGGGGGHHAVPRALHLAPSSARPLAKFAQPLAALLLRDVAGLHRQRHRHRVVVFAGAVAVAVVVRPTDRTIVLVI